MVHIFKTKVDLRYAMAAGLSHQAAEYLVDRLAVEPAQLSPYELEGLEMFFAGHDDLSSAGHNLKCLHQIITSALRCRHSYVIRAGHVSH